MAIYTYIDHETSAIVFDVALLDTVELTMNAIVFIDGLLKIVSFGVFLEDGCFTSEVWRTVDFIYVTTFLLSRLLEQTFSVQLVINYFK
jgi:hypothetical protein